MPEINSRLKQNMLWANIKKNPINKHIVCLKLPEHPPHPIHAPTNNELSGKNICNAQTKQKPKKKNKIRAKNTPLQNALEKKMGMSTESAQKN